MDSCIVHRMKTPPVTEPGLSELRGRVAQLEEETAQLRTKLDDLVKAYKTTTTDTYDMFKDYLWPVLFKVFPRFSGTVRQTNAILNVKGGWSSDDEGV